MRGRSVAIVLWQTMQVRTLGSPATGPVLTASWQYSVQAICLPAWMLCGNSSGCSGSGRQAKNSAAATPIVGRAVVNTASTCPGRSGVVADGFELSSSWQPMLPAKTSALRTRAVRTVSAGGFRARSGLGAGLRPDASDEVDDLPHVLFRESAFHRLHLRVCRRRAVPDHGEDLAVARSVIPFLVDETRRLRVLRRQRAVAEAAQAVTVPTVFRVQRPPRRDRRRGCRHRVLPRRKLRVTAPPLGVRARRQHCQRESDNRQFCYPPHDSVVSYPMNSNVLAGSSMISRASAATPVNARIDTSPTTFGQAPCDSWCRTARRRAVAIHTRPNSSRYIFTQKVDVSY